MLIIASGYTKMLKHVLGTTFPMNLLTALIDVVKVLRHFQWDSPLIL